MRVTASPSSPVDALGTKSGSCERRFQNRVRRQQTPSADRMRRTCERPTSRFVICRAHQLPAAAGRGAREDGVSAGPTG